MDRNVTVVTQPDLFIEGKPSIFLFGDGQWRNDILGYSNLQLNIPITYFMVDDTVECDTLIEWVYCSLELSDEVIVHISDELFENNFTNHMLLGYIINKVNTWVVIDRNLSEKYNDFKKLCEKLSPNPIDDDHIRQLSRIINTNYKKHRELF